MDPQLESRYLGLGLLVDSIAASLGSYRTLAVQQVQQLQVLQARVEELEKEKAVAQAVASTREPKPVSTA